MAEVVKELLVELSLEDNLLAIIGDNATDNESMAKSLGDHLHQKLGSRCRFKGFAVTCSVWPM